MSASEQNTGHRARLRERFQAHPGMLSESELLELLLTYAIPRQDVAPPSCALLESFGSLKGVLSASRPELLRVSGIGTQAAAIIELVGKLAVTAQAGGEANTSIPVQPAETGDEAHDPGSANLRLFEDEAEPATTEMRTFANDETANALSLIPEAHRFADVEAFRSYLRERLPYNSISTRQRRANYIVERYFPHGRLDSPLAYFAAWCTREDLQPALLYHLLVAEPLAAKVAEDLIWPAVSAGHLERHQVREFILRCLPEIGRATQTKVLQSLFSSFTQLGIATIDGTRVRFGIHPGTLPGFLYVLTTLYPRPGMYAFEELENGPMRRWLLWDREWMRQQLYNLRDLGIVSKVSEIDTIRQFTMGMGQSAGLQRYFARPPAVSTLREAPEPGTEEPEEQKL